MKAGHESSSAGRANWVDIIIFKNDSSIGKSIQVGSWHLVGSVKSYIIPTLEVLKHILIF